MNLYSDPHTALVLARYHQDVIREAFPRRPPFFSLPLPRRSRRLEVVPAAPVLDADRHRPPGSGSAAA